MRKPRTNILLLTILLVAVGLGGLAWLDGKPGASGRLSSIGSWPAVSDGSVKSVGFPRVAPLASGEVSAESVESLSDDASVLVAAMCDLQLLAAGTGLTLDDEQWSAFAAVVVRTQAIRHNYEAKIATLTMVAPGRYRADIPAYASAGDELRRQFTTELWTELGELTARDVLARLGERLDGRFAGFGIGVQTLDITTGRAEQLGDVQIARTASYWNSVAAGDHLTTRREMHFPALEDPTGDSWGALLAMVGVARAES